MSNRKLFLMRLRAVMEPPVRLGRRWMWRLAVLAAAAVLLAFSVGWWIYSRTSDEDLHQKATQLSRQTQYSQAVALYERVSDRSSQPDLAESALYDAATLYYYHLGDRRRALDLYHRLLSTYPNGRHVVDTCLRLGQIYETEPGDLRQAIRWWEEGIKVRPNARMVMSTEQYLEFLSKIAGGYFSLSEFEKALGVYQKIAADYPGTHKADQANLRVGIILQTERLYRASLSPLKNALRYTQCADCRFMAQTALVEAYENIDDLDAALQVVDTLAAPPGQEDYAKKERQRLRSKQYRLAQRVAAPKWRR